MAVPELIDLRANCSNFDWKDECFQHHLREQDKQTEVNATIIQCQSHTKGKSIPSVRK